MDSHVEELLARERARRRNERLQNGNPPGEISALASSFSFGHAAIADNNLFTLRQQEYSFANPQVFQREPRSPFDDADPNLLKGVFPARGGVRQPPAVYSSTSRTRLSLSASHGRTLFSETRSLPSQLQLPRPQAAIFNLSKFAYKPQATLDDVSSSPQGVVSSPTPLRPPRRAIQNLPQSRASFNEGEDLPLESVFNWQHCKLPSPSPTLVNAPPIVQGIPLVSIHDLPDRFRSIFHYPIFNAVQSKCFNAVYKTGDNIVIAAPTGSGKTVMLELAICRLIAGFAINSFKIVYQAPTKSLCAERQRDWQKKFAPLDLVCAELTGDTDSAQLRNVQSASIIITTPEKWDSMTRKWKDHRKLMELVKLFLIDEVHILKETRGATLEAVVSRMKSIGSDVRFVALSATVPNSQDVATWLGKDSTNLHLPAHREHFGEEFRPVKLQKFVYGSNFRGNDFAFDKVLDGKLLDVIAKHSKKKPIMIFCTTRSMATSTAKHLTSTWASQTPRDRFWHSPRQRMAFFDKDLENCVNSGVAYHHAGLDPLDRHMVEKNYLDGEISVICCTSTLAVGVNLPCHLVIVKNTVTWTSNGTRECADLEIMQMLGRAGRPQFDDSGVAVIMTRSDKVEHYERMTSGEDILESCLHLNLVEHLNAEIGLGTISDAYSAKQWLKGSFLYVRLKQNPSYYKLKGGSDTRDLDQRIEEICENNMKLLKVEGLVDSAGPRFKCTELGDAMSKYCIKFETMKTLLALKERARMSDILTALSQAEEFKEVRIKGGEKPLYKEINKANAIKFPINVDIALPAHKASLIIQSELGAVEFPAGEQFSKLRQQYMLDKTVIFQHVQRLIRCIIDCKLHLNDGISVRNGLELARSLSAKVWDNSPLQIKQISGLGPVAVRKLVAAGINSVEVLGTTEPHRIEMVLSRNPPFGNQTLAKVKEFPRLTVTARLAGTDAKRDEPVKVKVLAAIGYDNEKAPLFFNKRPVYITFLAETSDGDLLDFRRISVKRFTNGQEFIFMGTMSRHDQYILCYAMCDDIAGTMKYFQLKPDLDPSLFPTPRARLPTPAAPVSNISKAPRRPSDKSSLFRTALKVHRDDDNDEFDDDGIEDRDFIAAVGDLEFEHIDRYDNKIATETRRNTLANANLSEQGMVTNLDDTENDQEPSEPRQLGNGKWACNHRCKDKATCKHLCCRDGLDKPPNLPKKKGDQIAKKKGQPNRLPATSSRDTSRSRLPVSQEGSNWRPNTMRLSDIEVVDISQETGLDRPIRAPPKEYRKLDALHTKTQESAPVSTLARKKANFSYADGAQPELSFLGRNPPKIPFEVDSEEEFSPPPVEDLIASKREIGSAPFSAALHLRTDSSLFDHSITSSMEATMAGLDCTPALAIPKSNDTKVETERLNFGNSNDLSFDKLGENMRWSSPHTLSDAEVDLPKLPAVREPKASEPTRGNSLFVTDSPTASGLTRKRRRQISGSICPSQGGPLIMEMNISVDEGKENDNPTATDLKKARIAAEETAAPLGPVRESNRLEPAPRLDGNGNPIPEDLYELLDWLGDCVEFIG